MRFQAIIDIIGINPFVFVPAKILESLFKQSGTTKGKIPVVITIDGHEFRQTLIKFSGDWRLYLNTPMREAAGKQVGDSAIFTIVYDPVKREVPMHPLLGEMLQKNKTEAKVFDRLSPSRQNEIKRYFNGLKTETSVEKNLKRLMGFLKGNESFVGREKP